MADVIASIEVLGVYRVPVAEEELREDLRRLYFFGNAVRDVSSEIHSFIETCIPLALFELELDGLDGRFEMADFKQEMPGVPEKGWQVAYDEALLSSDGAHVVARNIKCTAGLRAGRIAFYFHYYAPSRPMLWTYGHFSGPVVQTVPRRLWDLIPYSPPVD